MYPRSPKQLRLDDQMVPQTVTPVAPARVPQVTAGAPKLNSPVVQSQATTALQAAQTAVGQLDLSRPLTAVVGSGGPERWDRAARANFRPTNLKRVTDTVAHPYLATEIMAQMPQVVGAFREKLERRRQGLTDKQITSSAFWQRYDSQGQGFVAGFLADIMGLLTESQRLQEQAPNILEFTTAQRQWLASHPLGRYMDWLP